MSTKVHADHCIDAGISVMSIVYIPVCLRDICIHKYKNIDYLLLVLKCAPFSNGTFLQSGITAVSQLDDMCI